MADDRSWHQVLRGDGQVVAFDPTCPHQETPLEGASLWDGNIRCPRHQYLYDPRTGENVEPAKTARPQNLWKLKPGYLPTYPVSEREGWLWVGEEPNAPPETYDPAREEPPSWTGPATPPEAEQSQAQATETGPAVTTKTVRVKAGATFELRLPINPLPGHIWHVELESGLLEVVEQSMVTTTDSPRWRVRLAARSPGRDVVICSFRQPWDVDPSEVRNYVVEVSAPREGEP
jgi:nitrite reductase/ring-hydroxylating ferredoxin subunit/predicted secreted protein